MLLQQLLERNKLNIRQVYLQQQKHKRYINKQFLKKKIPSDFNLFQSSLKIRSSNLLENLTKNLSTIKRNQSTRQTIKQSSFDINGNKFQFNDKKTQRKNTNTLDIKKTQFPETLQDKKQCFLDQSSTKMHSSALQFYKTNGNQTILSQRKISTAVNALKNSKERKLQKGVFDLPDSFTIKSSFMPYQRPHSTIIKYDKLNMTNREESIHSRRKMHRQIETKRKSRTQSQHNFYQQGEFQLRQNKKLDNYLEEQFESIPIRQQKKQLCIDVGKINLLDKPMKKTQYVNVFYEYRKTKAKIQKQDFYSPWKKHYKDRKEIDLSEFIQFHS